MHVNPAESTGVRPLQPTHDPVFSFFCVPPLFVYLTRDARDGTVQMLSAPSLSSPPSLCSASLFRASLPHPSGSRSRARGAGPQLARPRLTPPRCDLFILI